MAIRPWRWIPCPPAWTWRCPLPTSGPPSGNAAGACFERSGSSAARPCSRISRPPPSNGIAPAAPKPVCIRGVFAMADPGPRWRLGWPRPRRRSPPAITRRCCSRSPSPTSSIPVPSAVRPARPRAMGRLPACPSAPCWRRSLLWWMVRRRHCWPTSAIGVAGSCASGGSGAGRPALPVYWRPLIREWTPLGRALPFWLPWRPATTRP